MLQFLLQEGTEKIAEEIWQLLQEHPGEAVVIFLVIFIGLIVFFNFFIKRMSPYIAILCFIIAMVLTPLVLLAMYEKAVEGSIQQIGFLLLSSIEIRISSKMK